VHITGDKHFTSHRIPAFTALIIERVPKEYALHNFQLSYSAPTQQSNPVSSHCSIEVRNVVLYECNGVKINHHAKGMLTSESEDREEILIEEGNMENIREYYRVQFKSVFHWSKLNSAAA
jgi:hypothetical protein